MRPIILLFVLLPLFSRAQIITTIAGTGIAGSGGDGGPATAGQVSGPYGIGIDRSQNVFVADMSNRRVRQIRNTGFIYTVAGTGVFGSAGDGGPATAALFNYTYGVTADTGDWVYVSDYAGCRIRKFSVGGIINTVIGNGTSGFSGDGGPATAAAIYSPTGIAIDQQQNIYFGDRGNYRIRKVDAAGTITTIAGDGTWGFSGDGGPATNAKISLPSMIATDPGGNIWFADASNNRIRKVDTFGIITTVAGTGATAFSGDGMAATAAALNFPDGLTRDGCGNIYFNDAGNNRIRKINTAGIITTVAGTGTPGYSGDGGSPLLANISATKGLVADKFGNLYFAGNTVHYIRKIFIVAHAPAFTAGHIQSFTTCMDSVKNLDTVLSISDLDTAKTVNWTVLTAPVHGTLVASYSAITTGAAITPSGLSYTPAAGYTGSDSFKVQVADCGHLFDTTTVYVTVAPCGSTLGTVSAALPEVKLYPNPATTLLTVTSTAHINTISISNLVGETVYAHEYDAPHVQIDLANLPSGLYFIKINGAVVKRFVKE